MFAVFDLDGTLADISHRVHHVLKRPKDFDAFYQGIEFDTPVWPAIYTLQALVAVGWDVEIWTGRSDRVAEATREWLWVRNLGHIPLRMRPDADNRPTDEVKQAWLLDIPPRHRPRIVFEDQPKVVEMWRRNGILCFAAPWSE